MHLTTTQASATDMDTQFYLSYKPCNCCVVAVDVYT